MRPQGSHDAHVNPGGGGFGSVSRGYAKRSEAETLGPFTTYRWHVQPSGCAAGHPAAGGPCYGVVDVSQIRCRVHMLPSLDDPELFRLNTHVWEIS